MTRRAVILGFLLVAALQAAPPTSAAGQVAGAGGVVDSLLAEGRLQEAAWAAREVGDAPRADSLLARLEAILRRAPRAAEPRNLDSQGVSFTYRLDHGDGVRSIFKVDGSDIFCPQCGSDREVAAYRVDRLLGLDLTPMTVAQTLVHAGDTLHGSAMYYVAGGRVPDESGGTKSDALRFFDAVIGNSDRHRRNWLVLGDGRPVAIDHNRAFEYHPDTRPKTCWETEVDSIRAPARLGEPLRRYRTLPPDSLAAALEGLLDPALAREFVQMRERVVQRIDARIRDPARTPPLRDCRFRF